MKNRLCNSHGRLELKLPGLPAIYADFCSPSFKYRITRGGGRKQPLARAIGLKHNFKPLVFDATAGLGRDGFILASLGCRVIMCERDTVVHALLADGLRRAALAPDFAAICQRISLYCGASQEILELCQQQEPDVIYLDPMFPHRRKSALVKKEMRALRVVVGDDEDSDDLLNMSLQKAGQRVVCKRPAKAPCLKGPPPDFAINSPKHRFDVYLLRRQRTETRRQKMV